MLLYCFVRKVLIISYQRFWFDPVLLMGTGPLSMGVEGMGLRREGDTKVMISSNLLKGDED